MAHQAPQAPAPCAATRHPVAWLRRAAATAAAVAVVGVVAAPGASAVTTDSGGSGGAVISGAARPAGQVPAATAGTPPAGLYGSADPRYDGVWRQSLALLAQHTAGERATGSAVDWLLGQQCADGSFPAYRADPGAACGKKTPGDTNMTAAAAQALAAVGGGRPTAAVRKAVAWLRSRQNDDGGFGAMAGGPTDANSDAVVIGALAAAGHDPATVRSHAGHTPYEALTALQVGCGDGASAADRGAFAYTAAKGRLAPNALATTAAVVAARGRGLAVPAVKDTGSVPHTPSCGKGSDAKSGAAGGGSGDGGRAAARRAADAGAAYLAATLDHHGHRSESPSGGADVGGTVSAVLALAADGHADAARPSTTWLEHHAAGWARKGGPAAYAQLVLAAHAVGADPRHFGGHDLVRELDATGPAPASAARSDHASSSGGGVSVWLVIGIGLAVGAGIGFLISGRRKGQGL